MPGNSGADGWGRGAFRLDKMASGPAATAPELSYLCSPYVGVWMVGTTQGGKIGSHLASMTHLSLNKVRSRGPAILQAWVQIPALFLSGCVILSKSPNLCSPDVLCKQWLGCG
jgi:hypothetical protein